MRPPIESERSCQDIEFLAMGGTIGAALFLGPGSHLHTQNSTVIAAYALASVLVFAIRGLMTAVSARGPCGVTVTFLGAWSGWLAVLLAAMAELTAVGVLVHSRFPRVSPWITESAVLCALYGIDWLAVRMSPELRFWMACLKVMTRAAFRAASERKLLAGLVRIGTFAGLAVLGAVVLVVAVLIGLPQVDPLPSWLRDNSISSGMLTALADFHGDFIGLAWLELVGWTIATTGRLGRAPPREALSFVRILIFYLGTLIAAMIALPPTAIMASTSPWLVAARSLWPLTLTLLSAVLICALLSSTQFMTRGAALVLQSMADSRRRPAPLGSRDVRGGSMALTTAALSVTILVNCYIPARALGILITAAIVTIAVSFALFVLRLALDRPPHPPGDRASTPRQGDRSTSPSDARAPSSTRRSDHRVTPLERIRSSDVRRSPC